MSFFLWDFIKGVLIILTSANSFDRKLVFHVPDNAGLIWSEWEDASIVYDPRSGHTQVLNEFARELLALYEDGPKSLDQLLAEFSKIIDAEPDATTTQNIIETVAGFDNMGLIEPI
ncbi:MAG: HPr-rel-A system PqqD family peptide chaperone [Kordiimonadaceae bacterium]|nr:HPr-rel-A system PqqD family peptide chaperone [Kordiimonadaceae bacterium]